MSTHLLQLADEALQRGSYEESERLYIEALTDDESDPIESAKGLAILYGRAGRHFECMLMARCALRRARAIEDRLQEARCLGVLCTSLANIPAIDRLAQPLELLATLLDEHDAPRAWRMHKTAAFAQALHERRFDDARHLIDVLRERITHAPLAPNELEMLRFFEMRLAKAQRDGARHLALLDDFVREPHDPHPERLAFRIQRAAAQAAAGALADARQSAQEALQLLHDDQDASFISEIRASEGARLGRFFWETLHDLARSQEAFDLVTAALLNRVLQLDVTVTQLESAGVLDGADEAVHSEMRRDFMDAIIGMLREVSSIQRLAADDGAAALVFDPVEVGSALRVCAWCDSIQVPGRVWLPLGQFAPREQAAHVTHGMCESCHERERAAFA